MRLVAALTLVFGFGAPASSTGTGACYSDNLGNTIDCGGGYVLPVPVVHPVGGGGPAGSGWRTVLQVAVGSSGPCLVVVPAGSTLYLKVPACTPAAPGPPAPAADPAAVAVQFWKTVRLPVPRPSIPPGYAICGKTAYLVTDNTTTPAPYRFSTPLGPLTITAAGAYSVDWGDQNPAGFTGPYAFEGEPYPNGQITHVFDDVGSYTVTVVENWTATWQMGGASGTLTGLQTRAAIAGFRVEQLQAVVTG